MAYHSARRHAGCLREPRTGTCPAKRRPRVAVGALLRQRRGVFDVAIADAILAEGRRSTAGGRRPVRGAPALRAEKGI